MALTNLQSRADYVGDGLTSVYAYPFKALASSDLKATVRDTATPPVETTLALTTDYAVSGILDSAGGNVTLVNAGQSWLTAGKLKSGYRLTIRRVRPLTQQTDIRSQGPYKPELHEMQFDDFVMRNQQHQEELGRSLRLPETEAASVAAAVLPHAGTRANKFLAFDASGNLKVEATIKHGATVVVRASGDADFTSIQAAVDAGKRNILVDGEFVPSATVL